MSYVCPNGHSVSSTVAIRCPGHGCRALVTYEPMARGVALHEENEQLRELVATLGTERDLAQLELDQLKEAAMPFDPDWTIAPGATLADWIEENNLTVSATAVACGRMDPERMQAIINATEPLTNDDALRLQAGTGIPATLWLNLETRYRQDLARGKIDTTRS